MVNLLADITPEELREIEELREEQKPVNLLSDITPEERLEIEQLRREGYFKNLKKPEEIPDYENFSKEDWIKHTQSPEQIAKWRRQGEIGFLEAFNRYDKWQMIPYVGAGYEIAKELPMVGLMQKVTKDKATTEEKKKVYEFLADMAQIQVRGYSIGGKLIEGALQTIPFAIELLPAAFTAGGSLLATGSKEVAKKGAKEALKAATRATMKNLTSVSVKGLAKGAALKSTAVIPSVARNYGDALIHEGIGVTDKGQLIAKESETHPATTFARTLAQSVIDVEVELWGGKLLRAIGKPIGKTAGRYMPQKLVKALDDLGETSTGKTFSQLLKARDRIGLNGFWEEIGEERLADILKTTFDLDSEAGYSFEQFGRAIIPAWEDFLVEAGIISLFGMSSNASVMLASKLRERGVSSDDVSQIMKNTSELEKMQTYQKFIEQENEPFAAIEKDVFDKVINAGRTEEEAQSISRLVAARAKAVSNAYGINAQEWYENLGLEIQSVTREQIEEQFKSEEALFQENFNNQLKELGYDDNIYFDENSNQVINEQQNKIIKQYSNEVGKFISGLKINKKQLELGNTPQALIEAGLEQLPMEINIKVIEKVTRGKHKLKAKTVKALPYLLKDPIAVFKSATKENSVVVLVNAVDKNNLPVLVAVDKNNQKQGYKVNFITSSYGQDTSWFNKQIQEGRAIKINNKKYLSWLQRWTSRSDEKKSHPVSKQDTNTITDVNKDFNPLTQKKQSESPKGQIEFFESKNIITLFQNADESTIVHELGHLFLQDLSKLSESNKQAKKDLQAFNSWLGHKGGKYTKEQHEQFARGFEAYLMTGKAPTSGLKKAFENFKKWLTEIYESVVNLGVNMSPDVERAFDRLFYTPESYMQEPIDQKLIKKMVEQGLNVDAAKEAVKQLNEKQQLAVLDSINETPSTLAEIEKHYEMGDKTAKALEAALKEQSKKQEKKNKIKKGKANYNEIKANILKKADLIKNRNKTKQFEEVLKLNFEAVKHLYAKDRQKLINNFLKIQTPEQLKAEIDNILELAKTMEQVNYRRALKSEIEKILKPKVSVKKGSKRAGKYDFETNKYILDYKRIIKLSQEKAQEEKESIGDLAATSFPEKVKYKLLSYKANGFDYTSADMLESIRNDLLEIKKRGELAKDELDFEKRLIRNELVESALVVIKTAKADHKKDWKTKAFNLYRQGYGDVYSILNSILNKQLAEELDPSLAVTKKEAAAFERKENISKKAMSLLGIKSKFKFLKKVNDMGKDYITVTAKNGNIYDLSEWYVIDIYNSIKNQTTYAQWEYNFHIDEVENIIDNLFVENPEYKNLADYMMSDVQSYKDLNNQFNIEHFGLELKLHEHFWPRTSEYTDIEMSSDFNPQTLPGHLKERNNSKTVMPKPGNAWIKWDKHISESEYIHHQFKSYEKLARLINDSRVKNQIEYKFGEKTYNVLKNHVNDISLAKEQNRIDIAGDWFTFFLGNWVKSKVASPSVFVKQLISTLNYMENVPPVEFSKYFFEGLKGGKKTVDYMFNNSPYLRERYAKGYDEAIKLAVREGKILGAERQYYDKAITALTRMGDIGAILFGGYAQVKYNLSQGQTMEESIDLFVKQTESTQQSRNTAKLSAMQKSKKLGFILLFKNAPMQMMRKMVDSTVQYTKGEITAGQLAKNLMLYGVVNQFIFGLVGSFFRQWLDDEEGFKAEDFLIDGILSVLLFPTSVIPIVGDIINWQVRKMLGLDTFMDIVAIPMIDDVTRSFHELNEKENKTFADWLIALGGASEPVHSIPVKNFERYFKGIFGHKD